MRGVHLCLKMAKYLFFCLDRRNECFNTFIFVDCTVRTKDNECCVFPFMYKGERHFSCLPSLINGDWCATTHDYGKDKKWGECLGLLKIFVLDLIIFTELTGKKKKELRIPWPTPLTLSGRYCEFSCEAQWQKCGRFQTLNFCKKSDRK